MDCCADANPGNPLTFEPHECRYDPTMEADAVAREATRLEAVGATAEALATLEAGAERLAAADPAGAARLLIDAIQISLIVRGPQDAVGVAERAVQQAGVAGGLEAIRAAGRLGDALSWAGRYPEAREAWERAAADTGAVAPDLLAERSNALIRLGRPEGHAAAYRALVAARASGDKRLIADALNLATAAEVQTGRLREALRSAEELRTLVAGDASSIEADTIGLLAWVVALLGDAARFQGLVADLEGLHAALRVSSIGGLAQGLLSLSLGAAGDAADAFDARLAASRFDPVGAMLGLRPYGADVVEAYARAGRLDRARSFLAATLPVAVGSGQPRLIAPMFRAKGIVESDARAMERALEQHGEWANPFEEARTRLALGELLRRWRRRAEAREHLALAAAAFDRVGSLAWRERALAELRLAGDRSPAPHRVSIGGPDRLTRQEGEIVELLRAGLSNREIAERLVLSVKTVEGHLTTIYGKLGVASRAQVLATLGPRQGG
jgi:DNA-binding CsgD family transcriptional regulator